MNNHSKIKIRDINKKVKIFRINGSLFLKPFVFGSGVKNSVGSKVAFTFETV